MCGITGWVNFHQRLPNSHQILNNMTDSLTHRGPDASGTWLDKDIVAFGHRRLSIIDVEHGLQPMRHKGLNGHEAVVAFNGQIFNFRELRQQLQSLGYQFETKSDTEVLLKGYLHWKEEVVFHLNGMFAIAIWDCEKEQLVLIRDRLGVKPLYYSLTNQGLVFASEQKALFKYPSITPQVSREGFCEFLDMIKTPEMTVYDGISEVRPGTFLTFNRFGLEKKTYWALQAREHEDDLDTTILNVRNILLDTVSRQMVSDVPICSLLSGGLDSSAVTAMAAEGIPRHSLPTFSVDFSHNVSAFSADGVRGAPDAPFAKMLAEHVQSDHRELLLESAQMLENGVRSAVLEGVDAPPAYWGDMWPSLYLLFREIRKHSTVALSGEAADEIFGGYQWFRNPAAINANTFPWLTSGSSRYFGGIQLLDRDFVASLKRDEYRAMRYNEAIEEVPILLSESEEERRLRQVSYLAITRFLPTLLDRNDRMSMAVGLEVRVPFCDHRLVDYVFNIPWAMKKFDGREKSILREASRPYLPEGIINRIKTPYPATQDRAYEKGLRSELASVLENSRSPIHNLMDIKRTKAILDRDVAEISQPYNRGSIEMILWMDRWFNQYGVSVSA